jgi:hypothetical protein
MVWNSLHERSGTHGIAKFREEDSWRAAGIFGSEAEGEHDLHADPVITNANLKDYYKPGMTVQDTCWADPPDGRLVPDDYFGQFFTGGQPQPKILP